MTTRIRCLLGASLAAAALPLLVAGPLVAAARAAEPTPTLTSVSPTLTSVSPTAGADETVSGSGCVAGSAVRVRFDGAVLVTTRSTTTGAYSAHLEIPVSVASGPHRITVLCAGPSGAVVQTAVVTIGLPRTGSDTAPEVAIAVAMLLVGGTMLAATRRHAPRVAEVVVG